MENLVGLVGLEPTTPALSRRCSNQLSYKPKFPRNRSLFRDFPDSSHCSLLTTDKL